MRINIKATNIDLTPAIRRYAEEKTALLEKLIKPEDTSAKAYIEIGKITRHHQSGMIFRAEINLHVAGSALRAVSKKEDLYAALDDAKSEAARQLRKIKTRRTDRVRRSAARAKNALKRKIA